MAGDNVSRHRSRNPGTPWLKYGLAAVGGYLIYRALKSRGVIGDSYGSDYQAFPEPTPVLAPTRTATFSQPSGLLQRYQTRFSPKAAAPYTPPYIQGPVDTSPLRVLPKPSVTKSGVLPIYDPGQFDITGKPALAKLTTPKMDTLSRVYSNRAFEEKIKQQQDEEKAKDDLKKKLTKASVAYKKEFGLVSAVREEDAARCIAEFNAMVARNELEEKRAEDRFKFMDTSSPLQIAVDTLAAKSTSHQKGIRKMIKEWQKDRAELVAAQARIDAKGIELGSPGVPEHGALTPLGHVLNAMSIKELLSFDR